MKICQNCGAEVADTAKFCRKCGAKMMIPAPADPAGDAAAPDGQAGADQPLEEAAFEGDDYQWGPPTGGEDYDEQAMPAVLIGDAEEEPQGRQEPPRQPYTYRIETDGYDHTKEFSPEDISENKVTAMAAYLLGALGVIIGLLAGKESPYAKFHTHQGLKFVVVEALTAIITALLCWTIIVPAAAAVFYIILGVVKIISIVSVARGKAIEPPVIRSFGFLK